MMIRKESPMLRAVLAKIERAKMEAFLLNKERLALLPLLGVFGLIKSLALFIAMFSPEINSAALNYSPWWVATVPLLAIFTIPEVVNFWERTIFLAVRFLKRNIQSLDYWVDQKTEKVKVLKIFFNLMDF